MARKCAKLAEALISGFNAKRKLKEMLAGAEIARMPIYMR